MESWTPSTHSLTENGQTTLEVFAQPAFTQTAAGWRAIDSTISAGSGAFPFEAVGLANPVHFGTSADALVTIDTVNGPIAFGLDGAVVGTPTLADGVVTYADVARGVDLEFRTDGNRIGKHLVLANDAVATSFQFTITDPTHSLGTPSEQADDAWTFASSVAFGTGLELPAPAAWTQGDDSDNVGLPGSAHQNLAVTSTGYSIDLSVDPLWASTAEYPIVLDPAVQWTDETWYDDEGLAVAFGPVGEDTCSGQACPLADPVDGRITIGDLAGDSPDLGEHLAFVGADVSGLAGRQVSSAVLEGYDYLRRPVIDTVCDPIGPGSTGQDLAEARCGQPEASTTFGGRWSTDVTDTVRAVVGGSGQTGTTAGFALDAEDVDPQGFPAGGYTINSPDLRLVYAGYPVPRPLTRGQTYGCDCWAGRSTGNQALAADPVNTATGGLVEQFTDLSVAGVGQSIEVSRAYNSLDLTTGPFGPGWALSYGATLIEDAAGVLTFRDGSGTQSRFGRIQGGGYAALDAAVSATLTDGAGGTRVMRNLAGHTMTFDTAGRLLATADERGQGLSMTYTGAALTTVTDALGQTVTFGWDAGTVNGNNPRIVSAAVSDGRTVTYGYTTTAGARRLSAVTAAEGTTTTYGYRSTGELERITDPLGHVSARNTYDPTTRRITSQLDQNGAKTTFAWDSATQTATITDPTGMIRRDIYNGLNLVKQVDGNNATLQTLYDGDNNPSGLVDARNRLFRQEYDDRDRLVRRVAPAPLNYAESWTYDSADRVTGYTDAAGNIVTSTYNAAGLLTSQLLPDGTTTSLTYTTGTGGVPANLLASSTDQLGRTTTFTYDTAANLIATTTPGGKTTSTAYDNQHRVTSTTSPSGALTAFTYDAAGRILTTTDPTGAVTTNTYDTAGRLTTMTDAGGRTHTYTHDNADRLITTTDPTGAVTKTSYDSAGRVKTTTDAVGALTTYTYDTAGRMRTDTDPLGRVTTYTYNQLGELTTVTDPAGGTTTYTYDVLGRQTSVTDADGITQTSTYDERSNLTATTDALGHSQVSSFDALGRPSATVDADGVYTAYLYDAAGQLTTEARPRSTDNYVPGYDYDSTTHTYDLDGHRTSIVDPRGNVPGATPAAFTTTFTYDLDGRPKTSTTPLGQTTTTGYDAAGRSTTVTDPAGGVTSTVYNSVGWVTSVTDPIPATTSYLYDAAGRVTRRTDPLGHATAYAYDQAGRLLTQTDPLGRTTSTRYDAAGNTTATVKPSGTSTPNATDGTISHTYDPNNRLVGTSFSDSTPAFTYDYSPAGRLQEEARVQGTTIMFSAEPAYDGAGRTTSTVRTGPGAGTTNYARTPAGRLAGASWSTGQSAAYSYDAAGRLATITPAGTGNLTPVDYAYDPAGHITTVTRRGSPAKTTAGTYDGAGQLATWTHTAGASLLTGYEITRDSRGNPTTVVTTQGAPNGPTTSTSSYLFDPASRITRQCRLISAPTCGSTHPRTTYTYDKVGNRKTTFATTVSGTTPTTTTTTSSYDAADQLLTETVGSSTALTNTWTIDGALATTVTGAGTRTNTHDLSDELVATVLENGTSIGYTHDADGNRTSRTYNGTLDATWSWDDATGIPVRTGEYNPTGTLVRSWFSDPTSTVGGALATTNVTGPSEWLLADPFTNTAGSIATTATTLSGRRNLDAFGQPIMAATGTLATQPLSFVGQYLDSRTGLYDLRARDYAASNGRFSLTDPIAMPAGMPSVNGFNYGFGNPLRYTDATGNWPDALSCEALSGLCDSPRFFANEIIGAGQAGWSLALAIRHPVDTTKGGLAACEAGLDAWGNSASLEGGLQCIDNLNPIAGIRRNVASALDADCVETSGQSLGAGIFSAGLLVSPIRGVAGARTGVAAASSSTRFGPLNPGPLAGQVANTFRSASYTQTLLRQPISLYRVYGGLSRQIGPYWTRTRPAGPLQTQLDSALNPAWGNTATSVVEIRVPAGTVIYEGSAGPQQLAGGGSLVGGGNQVYISSVNPTWVVR